MLDPHACYELSVQSPRHVCAFLHAIHANQPLTLREDFCGTAAFSVRWVKDGADRGNRATAIDLDADALERAADHATRELPPAIRDRARLLRGDCIGAHAPASDEGADVVFVGNFSIGYLHTRAALLSYLRRSHARCALGSSGFGGGVFVCDIYGGASAFKLGGFVRKHPGKNGETIHYTWLHEEACPLTGMVTNSISYRVEKNGEIVAEWPRAFVYNWRLWPIAELREAMKEAGFARTAVYTDVNIAPGQTPQQVTDPQALGTDWTVLIAAWA
ncbi:MAG: class I SAM-dependent methyltransferase [Phycisphaerales bacterium]